MLTRSMSPRLRISSAANSSRRKSVERRGSQASVASAATVGRVPLKRPKFDSKPQMDTSRAVGMSYVALISSSRSWCFAIISRAVVICAAVTRWLRYFSSVCTVSACERSRSMTTALGSSMPARAWSMTSWRMPRASASVLMPSRNPAKEGRDGSCAVSRAVTRSRRYTTLSLYEAKRGRTTRQRVVLRPRLDSSLTSE